MSSKTPGNPYNERTECLPIDEAIEKALSQEHLPEISHTTRLSLIHAVTIVEGSSRAKALTCVAHEDIPRIREAVLAQIDPTRDRVDDIHDYNVQKIVQGNLRGMNQHCENCSTADCAHRTDLTLKTIREKSRLGKPLNSRKAKVEFPVKRDSSAPMSGAE